MPSIQEISEAVGQVSALTEDLSGRARASSSALKDHARQLAYLGQGSRSGEMAARVTDESARSLDAAVAAMDALRRACATYREALAQ